MYFTIKEMAEQLGVTPHKLRYYERVGIIEPHTNEATGYRYYSVRDTRRFNASQLYRSFGLSISECKELMGGAQDFSHMLDALDKQEETLLRELEYQLDRHSAFMFWKPFLADIMQDLDRVRPIRFPTVYRLTTAYNEKPIQEKTRREALRRWLELFPITSWASRIARDDLHLGDIATPYDYGLLIFERYMKKYGLEEDHAERMPGGTYLYTVFRKSTDTPFDLRPYRAVARYMEEEGFRPDGDGLSNCLYSTKEAGEIVNYHYFMVKAAKE